jgi:opacity protein-like surface antigen
MKKKSLLLTAVVTLGLTVATIAQNVPTYVPTNGLVGWWPFNGNANDESGNGNNGTVNGATLSADRFGNVNKSFSFNGSNNSIIVPDNQLLRPQSISISVWVLSNNLTSDGCIISKTQPGTAQGEQYIIGHDITGKANFQIKKNSNCSSGINWQYLYTPQSTISNNIWEHIVCTYDGITMKFYNNNILVSSFIPTAGSIDNCSGGSLNIGRFWQTQYHYNGKIDDIGIWNRALTPQEISDLYNGDICYQTITVTDTLLINMGITGFNPITYNNTIKIFPNPTNDHITINYGNFASLNGYQLKIMNSLGQQMFQTAINQQSNYISLASWTGNGIYFLHIIDPQGNTIDIRKIVLQ